MFLEKINSPQDLKKLTLQELTGLSSEVRERMVEAVSSSGGHLASSLGAVELVIALHYCLNAPKDKIVWDVGHQAYAHKILTGRNRDFPALRQYQGLSGFPTREESEYDVFTSGHSSSAVSLAVGLASARDQLPKNEQFRVAAVIGDGSLSGGLCFEGLNNAGHLKKDIIVMLNTNELSIAANAGALSTYLNKLISLPIYNRFKDSLESFMSTRMPRGSRLVKLANKFEEGLKGLFIPGMFFEELGFRYFGPFDGHNLNVLIPALKNILTIKGPRIMHVVTKKGKGYPPAEAEPVRFHGIGKFEIKSGKAVSEAKDKTYTQVFSAKLLELAKLDPGIVAVTAAMPEGTGLDKFRDLLPERFFDVGIAESHAVCFCAGLARAGLKPVLAVYSTFLQRAYDQLIEDVALQKLGVVLCVDRAGVVGEDGVTHQGLFDIAFLRSVPRLCIMAPKDAAELEQMLEFAFSLKLPAAIRYPKSIAPSLTQKSLPLELGKSELLKEGTDYALVALGSMVMNSLAAAEILEKEGLRGTIINARFVKPLDKELLSGLSCKHKFIFTVEEGIIDGGFGSAVSEMIGAPVTRLGLPLDFLEHGKRELLLEKFGLHPLGIAEAIKRALKNNG